MAIKKSIKINFARHSYQSESKSLSSQRMVNMYAENAPEDAKNQIALFNTPGLVEEYDLEVDNTVWGMQVMADELFAIAGVTVYKIDQSNNITNLGNMSGAEGPVFLSNNGTQLTIITGSGTGFIATTSSVVQITDPDYQLASSVTYLDGYSVFSKLDSDQFFWSKLTDSSSFDALDFATAEWEPDKLVSLFTFNGQLWAFGQDTIEVYSNTGAADLPFQRLSGATIEKGCAAKLSIAKEGNNLIWLGSDRKIYTAAGYDFREISTYTIHQAIENYVIVDDAKAFIYTEDGHEFYCLTFPREEKTWCYDLMTGLWHERESLKEDGRTETRWIPNAYAFFKGKNLIGDYKKGKIYELDREVFTEDGNTLISTIIGSVQFDDTNRVIIDRFRLDMEPGVGITTGQGSDPKVMMQYSKDGGFTWSAELLRSLGKIGEYLNRVVWRNLGIARSITFRIKISDPVKRIITGAYIDIDVGKP